MASIRLSPVKPNSLHLPGYLGSRAWGRANLVVDWAVAMPAAAKKRQRRTKKGRIGALLVSGGCAFGMREVENDGRRL